MNIIQRGAIHMLITFVGAVLVLWTNNVIFELLGLVISTQNVIAIERWQMKRSKI